MAPVVTVGLLNETINDLLWKFSYAIRLLLESDKYLIECDQLIIDFCTGLGVLDRAEQTFNLHSLRHLTWQVRNYGPLWTASWFAFQSAHHSLVSTFTGSVNHLRLLVERYLVKKSVLGSNIENDALFDLTSELISGRKKFTHGHLRNTDVVGELCNRAPSVTAKEMLHGVVFDSASDTKSSSNSHIMFFFQLVPISSFGQVIAFFDVGGRRFSLVELYSIEKSFECTGVNDVPSAFYLCKTTNEIIGVGLALMLFLLTPGPDDSVQIVFSMSQHSSMLSWLTLELK